MNSTSTSMTRTSIPTTQARGSGASATTTTTLTQTLAQPSSAIRNAEVAIGLFKFYLQRHDMFFNI